MYIHMIGIDHEKAAIDTRALFSFTKKQAGAAMEELKNEPGIDGCVILSTCNRLEVWVSSEVDQPPLLLWLCAHKGLACEEYRDYFVSREGEEAVRHLFYLTAGLKSQILGEDQILTQVKDALSLAREHFASDSVLEVLFRMAVTAGKQIKTEVAFAHGSRSVIHEAIDMLEHRGFYLQEKTCMVIGNGDMGRVTAQALLEKGARVHVTVRQYRSGVVDIPWGCERLNYTDRMGLLPRCDLVVSATASPNYTLRLEQFRDIHLTKPLVLIDLAVPRDVEPEIGQLPGITFYDMDSFGKDRAFSEQSESLEKARAIVEKQMEEYHGWLTGRDVIPRIQGIQREAAHDLFLRIEKPFKKAPMEEETRLALEDTVQTAAGKVLGKLFYGLRDSLTPDAFMNCVEVLEKLYEK